MKCDKCGYSDNGSGDWAHACGPVAVQRAPVANERIQELADKAIEDMPGAWNIPDEFCEKFAELIVRECIDTAFHNGHPDLEFLLKHFVVEE